MVLGNQEKVSILISALEARYRALGALGEQVRRLGLWSLGGMLVAAGCIVWSGAILADDQTVILCLGLLAGWLAVRFGLISGLARRFTEELETAGALEDLLGLHTSNRFGSDSPAALARTSRAGAKGGQAPFAGAPLLIDVGLAVLLIAILSRGDWVRAWAEAASKMVNL